LIYIFLTSIHWKCWIKSFFILSDFSLF